MEKVAERVLDVLEAYYAKPVSTSVHVLTATGTLSARSVHHFTGVAWRR